MGSFDDQQGGAKGRGRVGKSIKAKLAKRGRGRGKGQGQGQGQEQGQSRSDAIVASRKNAVANVRAQQQTMTVLHLFFAFAFFYVYYTIFFKYMTRLEEVGCKCATDDWRHKFLKVYFLFMAVYLLVLTIYGMVHGDCSLCGENMQTFRMIVSMYILISSLVTWSYVSDLYLMQCSCSEHIDRDIMTLLSLIPIFMYALNFLMIVVFVILFGLNKVTG
jgi:hypothetical protein